MAALETIRKRAVLLTVVIGLALLAFILGDLINSGQAFFGDGNTIVKVGDKKIDALEFQKRYEQVSAQYQNAGAQMPDGAVIQNTVIEGMISEMLLAEELDAVGIYVTDAELTEAMTGAGASQYMYQYAQQMGCESPAQLYDLLFNPAKYGATEADVAAAKADWIRMEGEVEKMLKSIKLQTLIVGAMQANELDKKYLFEENATTSEVAYVRADYSALNGEEYEPTAAELKAKYNEIKNVFRLDNEQRTGRVITVDIKPSLKDQAASKAIVDTTMTLLRANAGIDAVRNNGELVIAENYWKLDDITNTQIKEFVEKAKVGDVLEPSFVANEYTIAKLVGKEMAVESVDMNIVTVSGDKNVQDSIKNALNSGKAFAEVVNGANVQGQENVKQTLVGAADSIKAKVLKADANYFALTENDQMAYFVKVVKKEEPKQFYNVAVITHKVYPSKETTNGLRDNLQAFINENNTLAALDSNAVKAGYQPMPVVVYSNTPQVNGIDGTREAVKWMFGANKGAVSPILDAAGKEKMVVVALEEVFEAGYLPMNETQVNALLTAQVRNEKKGAALVEKYAGKANSLEEYATLMESKVDTAQVTFGQQFIPGLGMGENCFVAGVTVAEEGKMSEVLKGNAAAYVYQVIKHNHSDRTPGAEIDRQFASSRGSSAVMQNIEAILRGATTVENNMIKFF